MNAERGVAALLDRFRPSGLIGVGVAGGLSPSLEAGAILVGREVRDLHESALYPDESWVKRAMRTCAGVEVGTLVTADRVLWSASAKAAMWDSLERREPAAVDMESAWWARTASRYGLPYLIARAILEKAEEELPAFLASCGSPTGGPSRARVILHAVGRPQVIGRLLWMRTRLRLCAQRLADFVTLFLNPDS